MTVYDYIKGIFSKDSRIFRLSNSDKINPRWRGKAFSELPDNDQRKIRNTTIHAIIFEQIHPNNDDTSLYQVFERINTSGRSLLPQEIRNCVYQGDLNSLLIRLNKNESWRSLVGLPTVDPRMRDIEYILRFFAFSSNDMKTRTKGRISIKKYLNQFMGNPSSNTAEAIAKFENKFISMTSFVLINIGEFAFSSISNKDREKYSSRFHPTIFDAVAVSSLYASEAFASVPPDIKERHRALLLADDFKELTTSETMVVSNINSRIKMAAARLFDLNYE